jgi:cytochrome c-type biogenesis protein CcmH
MFWILSVLLAAAVATLILLALWKGGKTQGAAEADMKVYRDQLREVERDLERGVVSAAEAETIRLEVSRRLLDADRQTGAEAGSRAPHAVTGAAAALLAVGIIGGAFALYRELGAPGYPDLPLATRIAMAEDARANRPDQATAEAEAAALPRLPVQAGEDYLRLMERLRETVADRPDDVQGQRLLARNEAALGNFADARAAQERVVALLGDAAAGQDYADLADLMVLGAGGYVSPEAEAALARALERDPTNGAARYYSGLLMIQVGRPDLGFRLWSGLLEQSRPDDPWVGPIASQIRGLAQIAGERNYQMPQLSAAPLPPAPPPGPTTEQVEAAADMTPEERMEMIRGMVTGLSDRLASEGGPPEDWARLIGALGVLGEAEQARAIAEEAEEVFAGNDPALSMIAEARIRAGLD